MKVNRRDFLKMVVAGASVATASTVLAASQTVDEERVAASQTPGRGDERLAGRPRTTPTPSRTPAALATPTATPAPTKTPRTRKLFAWLRMFELDHMPHSGASYEANLERFDVVMPLNGGKLTGDGSWAQEGPKLRPDWPQALPALARRSGHLYMPGLGNDRNGTLAVLESARLQDRAATELVALAKEKRFDAPWDGVFLDIEAVDYEYRPEMSDFLQRLARRVKDAGMLFGISVSGIDVSPGADPDKTDAYDFRVVAELADFVDLRCYDYWSPPPRSIGPYWWIERSIQFALDKRIPARKLSVGLANFSRYWPDSRSGQSYEMTHAQAIARVDELEASVEWVERNRHGLVREKYAKAGEGHLWIHDGETYRADLKLIEQYGLTGNTIFAPGMGDPEDYQMIAAWQARAPAVSTGTG